MENPFAVVIGCKVVARFNDWQSAAQYADLTNEAHAYDIAGNPTGDIADVINLEFDADDIEAWRIVEA